jgi:hypothetical protein
MTQWLRLQLADGKYAGKQVIAGDALAETHRPQIISHAPADADSDRAGFYGLGWNVNYDRQGRVRFNHSGGFDLGAATYVALVPTEHLGVVILTNGAPTGIPEALGAIFCDLALEGHPTNDWFPLYEQAFEEISKPTYGGTIDYNKPPQKKLPALANSSYLGTFSNELYGNAEVAESGGKLQLKLGPKLKPYALEHWERDIFLYQPVGEMSGGLSQVAFTVGADQKATQLVIENLDVGGQGTFSRLPR